MGLHSRLLKLDLVQCYFYRFLIDFLLNSYCDLCNPIYLIILFFCKIFILINQSQFSIKGFLIDGFQGWICQLSLKEYSLCVIFLTGVVFNYKVHFESFHIKTSSRVIAYLCANFHFLAFHFRWEGICFFLGILLFF